MAYAASAKVAGDVSSRGEDPEQTSQRAQDGVTQPRDWSRSTDEGSPSLAPGVELLGEYEGSGYRAPRYMVRRGDDQLVQTTALLYQILEQIDGSKTYQQIAEAVSHSYGKTVSSDNVRELVAKRLRADGLVAGPDGQTPKLQKPDPLLQLKLRVTLMPERAVNLFAVLLRPLFWPPVMVAVLAGLVALDIWYFGVHGIGQSLRDLIYQPLVILMLYGLLILSIGWHELGHATACRYGGARPGKIGFGIYIVWPAFYTDVTDVYRLGKRGRVRTDIGGVYFNAIFALAIAGIYFATGFEPLLALIILQHLLMLYQFMPFLRMDGYYVVSDLTGVPDLFARIKPTLQSLIPWKKTPERVRELKPWVRVVVSAWVLTVIPVLIYLFGMMVLSAPRLVTTAWDSAGLLSDKFASSLDEGRTASAATNGLQIGMLVLPLMGMTVTFTRVGKRAVVGTGRLMRERPVAGTAVALAGVSVIAAAAFVLWPNGEYKPIQPGERWTFEESVTVLSEVDTGRPALTSARETELGGAPLLSDTGEEFEPSRPEDTEGTGDRDVEPEPTMTPEEGETLEEETPEPTPSPSPSVAPTSPTE